jgi:hypothetical protein
VSGKDKTLARGLTFDPVTFDEAEQKIGTRSRSAHQAFAVVGSERPQGMRRLVPQVGNNLTEISPGCSPADLVRLKDRNVATRFRRVESGRKASETSAYDSDINRGGSIEGTCWWRRTR